MKNDKLSKNKGVEHPIQTKNKKKSNTFKKKVFLRQHKKEQSNINKLREARIHKNVIFALKITYLSIIFAFFVYILILISQSKQSIGNYLSEHSLIEWLSPEEKLPVVVETEEIEWDKSLWLISKSLDKRLDREINDTKYFNIYQDIPEEIRKDVPLTQEEFIKYVDSKKLSFCKYVTNVYSVYYYATNKPLALDLGNTLYKPFTGKEDCMQEDYYTSDNLYAIYMAIHDNFINTTFKLNPVKIEEINKAKVVQYHQTYNVTYNLPPFLKSSKQISIEKFTQLISDSYNRKLYCSYATNFVNVYNKYMKDKVIATVQLPCTSEQFDESIEYQYYTTIFNTLYGVDSKIEGSVENMALKDLLAAEVPLD